jgi:hypothetical protein
MGAVIGLWLPQRLKKAGAGKSLVIGLVIGAAVGALAALLSFLMDEISILNTQYHPDQFQIVQETFLRESFVLFRNVVPTAALWVGWWAWRWNKRLRNGIAQPQFKCA